MADIGSNAVWHVYPADVPFFDITLQRNPVDVGKNGSGINNAPVCLRRVVWRTDANTAVGDTIALQDKNGRDVFKHTREADDVGEITRNMHGATYWGLKLVDLKAGVLDLYID